MQLPLVLALTAGQWYLMIFLMVVLMAFGIVCIRFASLWFQSLSTRAGIGLWSMILMSLRRVNPADIVRSRMMAVQAGLLEKYPLPTRSLEAHCLAGGDVKKVIRALIVADKASIELDWNTAQA
ncbi:MAG: hypothetical protein RL215_2585, partial [Planctomycetota bacterium]